MSQNIIDVLAPLHWMSKFCGYSIFTIKRSDFSISCKRIDIAFYCWVVFINCCLNGFNIYLWDASQSFPLHNSGIISKSLPVLLSGSYGLYLISMIASTAMRQKQSILMKSICEIDETVRRWRSENLSILMSTISSCRSLEFISIIVVSGDR